MSASNLLLGALESSAVLAAGEGITDAGTAYKVLAVAGPIAPAGAGGECSFTMLRLVVTHTMGVTLLVTPIVDGVELTDAQVSVTLPTSTARTTTIREVGLRRTRSTESGMVIGRFALRGTWFQVRIEAQAVAAGELLIEPPEVEYEVVRESRKAG